MKRLLCIIFSLIIIFFILFYIINDKLNIDKIIKKIENDIGISIKLEEKGKWKYYPKLKYQNNLSLKTINDNLVIENSKVNILRNYRIVSPLIINFESPSILYKSINFRNSIIDAEHYKGYLYINKFYADVIDGNINLSAKFDLDKKKEISIKGNYNNISLNQVLKQMNISNWDRVQIKLSSSNFLINTIYGSSGEIIKNLNGHIDVNGSVFFISTEEERFGATFLKLLADKFIKQSSISQSLSYIFETFADIPSDILGKITIKNGVLITKNLLISNKKEKSLLSAELDLQKNIIDGKIDLYKNNKIYLTAEFKGNIKNPKISINGNDLSDKKNLQTQNVREIFEKGIKSIFDNIINQND